MQTLSLQEQPQAFPTNSEVVTAPVTQDYNGSKTSYYGEGLCTASGTSATVKVDFTYVANAIYTVNIWAQATSLSLLSETFIDYSSLLGKDLPESHCNHNFLPWIG